MNKILITNAKIVNNDRIIESDILINPPFIERIAPQISEKNASVLDAGGLLLFPGLIDDQVHFREPGLTHKADIFTESRAAVAGGITTYMEMPNTIPHAVTQEILENKYQIAEKRSVANFSFYLGATNNNLDEILKTDPENVCGIKIFMGSSTGNMLVDDENALNKIFSGSPILIATHCEDEKTIRAKSQEAKLQYGENVPVELHPEIRSEDACYLSSSFAVSLAKKHGTKLHILHISTAKELSLFDSKPLEEKKITAEACIHHLWFSREDYQNRGNLIKWNPAVKKASDREAIRNAVKSGLIDVIATDHAPHTLEEKSNTYFKVPSGGPLVQHALPALLELVHSEIFSYEMVARKMAHNPAILFQIDRRGFVEEGYFADLVLVDPDNKWTVNRSNILAKCGWSPFEDITFRSNIVKTFVNGCLVYDMGKIIEGSTGMRLKFNR